MERHNGRRRSIEPYLKFVRLLDDEIPIDTRVDHILDTVTERGFDRLLSDLDDAGVRAGFSIPSIHIEEDEWLEPKMDRLLEDGHEILLHGHRHSSYMAVDYGTAHEELSHAIERVRSSVGVEPTGFHVPYGRVSRGTVEAASELGIERIVGTLSDRELDGTPFDQGLDDDSVEPTIVTPVRPYDLHLFERGLEPEAVFDELDRMADESSLLLLHPNVHASQEGLATFASWLDRTDCRTPSDLVAGTGSGPGLLLDVFPPFRVA